MRNKTILFIAPSLNLGGTEMHLTQVLPGLKAKGWDVSVYLTSGTGPLVSKMVKNQIAVINPSNFLLKLHSYSKLLRAPFILFTILKISFHILRYRPAIVQFMLPEAYLIGGISCILARQKVMVMSRRSLNNYQNKYPFLTIIERWLHTKMNLIITNSKANIKELNLIESVPQEKLKLIYNGIDTKRFKSIELMDQFKIRNELNLAPSTLSFIVIANLIPYKGHDDLLHALARIYTQLPSDWQLLCVGKKYDYANELAAIADNLNIGSHIKWLGEQNEIDKFIAISHIGICCSHEEGFSNAVIEIMAAGLPIIATNVGGNPEAIIDGACGIIVPPHDPSALGKAILHLVSNPKISDNMGKVARQRVFDEFSLESCINNYHKAYLGLL